MTSASMSSSSSSSERKLGWWMSTSEDARVEGGSMFIMEEAQVDASLMDASSSTFSGGSISAIEGNVKIWVDILSRNDITITVENDTRLAWLLEKCRKRLYSFDGCLLRLTATLIAVSEREDLDLSEAVDGE
jgi:hypothetical protein